jgi:hypothetical protein
MRKDRDGSVLSYVKVSRWLQIAHLDELELVVDAETIVLSSDCLWHRLGMVAKLGLMVQITSRTHMFSQILVLSCELQ